MRLIVSLASAALGLAVWVGGVGAAGPTPGQGPWQLCPNNSEICARQLGPDLYTDVNDEDFDCLTRNDRAGIGLINGNSGRAHCWAV